MIHFSILATPISELWLFFCLIKCMVCSRTPEVSEGERCMCSPADAQGAST